MKRILKTSEEAGSIHIQDCASNYLYAYKGTVSVYKLHCLSLDDDTWAWIDMKTSDCLADGDYKSFQTALKNCSETTYQFNSIQEFCNWALEVLEK